jgi:heparan-alpha-glucosaminide N-acetyltransferase
MTPAGSRHVCRDETQNKGDILGSKLTGAVDLTTNKLAGSSFSKRVLSIDAFRGLTILIMIFVNTVSGVRGIPAWMEHMPGNVDGMTFVDVVFPAFLFIVGMSIPFAMAQRRGETFFQGQKHILLRAAGLIVIGVFMVNAEEGYNEAAMHMSINLWSVLVYCCVILIWNVYTFRNTAISTTLRVCGIIGLIILGLIFRAGPAGDLRLAPQWWGILGLIGWAYLYTCIFYQLSRGLIVILLVVLGLCVTYYCIGHTGDLSNSWWFDQTENASHTSIAICGLICSLIFFDATHEKTIQYRFLQAAMLAILLVIVGYLLRPYFKISKIDATPSWCLYSSAICIALFGLLYWIVDLKNWKNWTKFFRPAASNPLLAYIIPYIVYAVTESSPLALPDVLHQGIPGMIWAAGYAVAVMVVVIGLNRLKIRLQL